MKKPNSSIDYTPRRPVPARRDERVVFGAPVGIQRAPFFEVHVAGHSVVFTDRREEAHSALRTGHTLPRELSMVDAYGRRTLLEAVR